MVQGVAQVHAAVAQQAGNGLLRESIDERGHTIGAANDETAMRAFWRNYKELMAPEPSEGADR